ERGATDRPRFTSLEPAHEKLQVDRLFRIVVCDTLEQSTHDHVDSQFLLQLAREALLEGFARLTFTAGEFPQSAKMRAFLPFGNEDFTITEDQTCGHVGDAMLDSGGWMRDCSRLVFGRR